VCRRASAAVRGPLTPERIQGVALGAQIIKVHVCCQRERVGAFEPLAEDVVSWQPCDRLDEIVVLVHAERLKGPMHCSLDAGCGESVHERAADVHCLALEVQVAPPKCQELLEA